MTRWLLLAAMFVFLPTVAHAGKKSAKDTVAIEIDTNRGPAVIKLVREGDGFVGPRGEYYPAFPSKKTLSAVYGAPAKSVATPRSGSGAVSGEIKVVVVQGGVNIRRNGKPFSRIRTKFADVRGWKLIRENSQIVIKSGVDREPGLVELFDVRTGKLEGRIKATDVKNGKPAWARSFAE